MTLQVEHSEDTVQADFGHVGIVAAAQLPSRDLFSREVGEDEMRISLAPETVDNIQTLHVPPALVIVVQAFAAEDVLFT